MKLKESNLIIEGSPKDAIVKVNGEEIGKIPTEKLALTYGEYHISISKPGFFSTDESITINNEYDFRHNIHLEPKSKLSAGLYSTLLPGSGQVYSGRPLKGKSFLAK